MVDWYGVVEHIKDEVDKGDPLRLRWLSEYKIELGPLTDADGLDVEGASQTGTEVVDEDDEPSFFIFTQDELRVFIHSVRAAHDMRRERARS